MVLKFKVKAKRLRTALNPFQRRGSDATVSFPEPYPPPSLPQELESPLAELPTGHEVHEIYSVTTHNQHTLEPVATSQRVETVEAASANFETQDAPESRRSKNVALNHTVPIPVSIEEFGTPSDQPQKALPVHDTREVKSDTRTRRIRICSLALERLAKHMFLALILVMAARNAAGCARIFWHLLKASASSLPSLQRSSFLGFERRLPGTCHSAPLRIAGTVNTSRGALTNTKFIQYFDCWVNSLASGPTRSLYLLRDLRGCPSRYLIILPAVSSIMDALAFQNSA